MSRRTSNIYPIKPTKKYSYDEKLQKAFEELPEDKPCIPRFVIIIEAVLALLAVSAAVLLALSLSTEYTHTYITAHTPLAITAESSAPACDTTSVDDIPLPPYVPVYYDFGDEIPQGAAVGYEYFNDTVFIGDSRTKGLIMYTEMSPYDFSSVGTNVGTVQVTPFIRMKDENDEFHSYTLFEALEKESGNYKTVYIALGLNELGWPVEKFEITYRELIVKIREVTNVPIYIQLIMPVTTKAAETTEFGITNEKAAIFNLHLRKIAAEMSLFLLDPTDIFALEDGTLDPAHASDGVHLQIASYPAIADYYRTHIVDTDAYDNTRNMFNKAELYEE